MAFHMKNLLLTGKFNHRKLFRFSFQEQLTQLEKFSINLMNFDYTNYRKSLNYDDDTYYSKDPQNSYGSITAIKNR